MVEAQRQASTVVYREVTEEYWAPLGVWVIREGVREAMRSHGTSLETIDEAVDLVSSKVRLKEWHRKARHVREAKVQRRLEDFS